MPFAQLEKDQLISGLAPDGECPETTEPYIAAALASLARATVGTCSAVDRRINCWSWSGYLRRP
jgi:hypothetical protein